VYPWPVQVRTQVLPTTVVLYAQALVYVFAGELSEADDASGRQHWVRQVGSVMVLQLPSVQVVVVFAPDLHRGQESRQTEPEM
jgi:hypothetical protein